MALELVTVEEAKEWLHLSGSSYDAWLAFAIPAVTAAVAQWLKDEWRLYVPELDENGDVVIDSSGDPVPSQDSGGYVIQPNVKIAIVLELASMDQFRAGEGVDNAVPETAGHGYILNKASTNMLAALRKTTIA